MAIPTDKEIDDKLYAFGMQAHQDARRFRWFEEHYNDQVAIHQKAGLQPVWEWIKDNAERMGGLRACIDHLMDLEDAGGVG